MSGVGPNIIGRSSLGPVTSIHIRSSPFSGVIPFDRFAASRHPHRLLFRSTWLVSSSSVFGPRIASRTRSTLSGGNLATAVAHSTGTSSPPASLPEPLGSLAASSFGRLLSLPSNHPHLGRIHLQSDSSNTPGLRCQRPSKGVYINLDYPIHRTVLSVLIYPPVGHQLSNLMSVSVRHA